VILSQIRSWEWGLLRAQSGAISLDLCDSCQPDKAIDRLDLIGWFLKSCDWFWGVVEVLRSRKISLLSGSGKKW
jgi:hypothetical protein